MNIKNITEIMKHYYMQFVEVSDSVSNSVISPY